MKSNDIQWNQIESKEIALIQLISNEPTRIIEKCE